MKRRALLLGITVLILALVLAAQQQPANPTLPILQRAQKATDKSPPVAVLIEMGLKDQQPTDWSGSGSVEGAKIVHKEGYHFWKGDKLTDQPLGWQASSRYSIRSSPDTPIIKKMEGVNSVGVVVHLADIKKDAVLKVKAGTDNEAATVPLAKILAGEAVSLWNGAAVARRVSAATPAATGPGEHDQPAATYGPDGTLWVAYTTYKLRRPQRQNGTGMFKEEPKDFKFLDVPDFAEQVWLRAFRDGKWGEAKAVTDARQDIARCAVAVSNDNQVWVIYSAQRKGNFDLYARLMMDGHPEVAFPSKEIRLTDNPGPDLSPVACVDSKGKIWVAYQSWSKDGLARIGYLTCAEGKWSKPKTIEPGKDSGNCWHAAISASPKGQVAVAYDAYREGNYCVDVAFIADKVSTHHIDRWSYFQARPSIAYDSAGSLWLAYELGPKNWGKNYGALDNEKGHPLYDGRTVEVFRLDYPPQELAMFDFGAKLPKLEVTSPTLPMDAIKFNKFERHPRYAYPQIGIDGKGRVWLTYRRNFGSRYASIPGAIWKTYGRRLDDNRWSEEILIHHSDGLLDHRPVLLPHVSGGLRIVHNTDGREATPETIHNQIYAATVDMERAPAKPAILDQKLRRPFGYKDLAAAIEAADIKRMRDYRIKSGGKTYQFLRGEFHRHTEISWDGGGDGSLEDMFRYAIDAAGMDWIGNGDHDNGGGREYTWWLTQKWTDAYHVAGKFTPMFTYERSVEYPHGHRNCMFARRGVLTLPRLAPPDDGEKHPGNVHADDTKMLYKYLHYFDGICAAHTSATVMGTDWRDNDPVVEPIVEIYQGDRMSYEYEGAPRAGYDPKEKKLPINIGGWRPLGYLDNALKKKGYKLGFQASSDHWSTHISYFIVIAEKHDRAGILAAVKQRHCYGATDNIIVDLRSGEHIQGDAFETQAAPALQFTVRGTAKISKIEVLKDSAPVATIKPDKDVYKGEWTDPEPDAQTHYYYIRVLQANGELAWASPIWITKK